MLQHIFTDSFEYQYDYETDSYKWILMRTNIRSMIMKQIDSQN